MTGRRGFVKGLSLAIPASVLGGQGAVTDDVTTQSTGRDYFAELGVKRFINAAGAYSMLGGARMRDEVIEAMRYATTRKVKMRELHDAVGIRIAELAGSEAAMVTSGATASMVLGTAACMTLGDEQRMRQLPDTTGMPDEIVIQTKHRYTYDRALTVAGGRLVEVGSEQELRDKVGEKTAMMFFLKPTQQGDDIPAARWVELAHELGVPSFCDAATTTPPATNVIDTLHEGFDLVCFSGGKGLRGPYSAGLLLGRADLVAHARRHSAPNDISIGRGMKVSAEEYLGMLVAFETALRIDEETDFAYKRRRFERIIGKLADVPGVTTRIFVSEGHANELYLDIDWDRAVIDLEREQLVELLREHDPAVEVRLMLFSGGRIHLSATVLDEGEDVIVGEIIRKVLLAHA